MIAFHTKHIMGAPSVKAGFPLRAGFIELAEKGGREKSLQRSGLREERRRLVAPRRDPRARPSGRVGRSQRRAGPSADPRRSPAAERMSAQVGTRLRFRHRGTAAGGEREKSRSSSPPSPRCAARPAAPTAALGAGARHCDLRTQAAPSAKVPPPQIANPAAMSPAPPHPQRLPPREGSCTGAWKGQGGRSPGPGTRDPEDDPLSPSPAGLCHPRGPPAAGSGLRGSRPPPAGV